MDPDIAQLPGDIDLLIDCEGDTRCLFPIPERRIKNSDLFRCVRLFDEENDLPRE